MKHQLYIYSILTLTFFTLATPAHAVLMKGDGVRLQTELFNTFTKQKIVVQGTSGKGEEANTSQFNPSQTTSTTSTSQTGSLALSVNPDSIDFGTLAAGEPIQRSITVSADSQDGYSLQIAEDAPLSSKDNKIPDTTCDKGNCTPSMSSTWQSPLVFGFGYACKSRSLCEGFGSESEYKPLPSVSDGLRPSTLVTSILGGPTSTELTFKVNISQSDSGYVYKNNIILYSLPNY